MDSENDGAVDSDGAHSVGNTLIIEAMRSMIGDLRTHVDGKFSDHQVQAQDNAEKVTLLTQTVAALQDQVAELQNRRDRSRSRSSRASSMPEEQKLARRAEKRPEVPSAPPPGSSAVVPVIAQPPQGDPLSPVVFAAQFDEVDQFNGSFPAIPADLYAEDTWSFSNAEFLEAQNHTHVYRTDTESKARWRKRTFLAIAGLAQRRAESAAAARHRPKHALMPAVAAPAPSTPAPRHSPASEPTPPRSTGPHELGSRPHFPKQYYQDLHDRLQSAREESRDRSPFAAPVPALRAQSVGLGTPAPEIVFSEGQLRNMHNAHALDARLLRALYSFENAYLEVVPVKTNVKIELQTYSGDNDFATLEDFLNQFYEWLVVQGLTDSKGIAQATGIIGLSLRGAARNWFSTERALRIQAGRPWSLDQIVVALRQRFVHLTAESSANDKFDAIKMGSGGVAELWNDLERAASYLVEYPTPYSMRTHFMDALPEAFARRMLSTGFSAERRSIEELVQAASDIEAGARLSAARREKAARNARVVEQVAPAHLAPEAPLQTPRKASTRAEPRAVDKPSASPAPLPVSTVGGSSAASTNANKPLATTPARPGSIYPTQDDKNCWRCGKFGHIGRNCPDLQPAAVTARANAGALVHFNSTATDNPREIVVHDDFADHSGHRDDNFGERTATSAVKSGSDETRDEYAGLGYTAQDIEAVYDEPDTSQWVFNNDDDE
ncbi:hypothetical protein AURDEDRAFT_173355 [Auricularia subglabra TFB-10046 SS5]|nr:hypothetical protein AURDEDRAFT_173355 [Auricularia subglabra TFB-10046 SS5]